MFELSALTLTLMQFLIPDCLMTRSYLYMEKELTMVEKALASVAKTMLSSLMSSGVWLKLSLTMDPSKFCMLSIF